MSDSNTSSSNRRKPNKNVFTTKSGNVIKLNRSFGEKLRANREQRIRKRAAYLSSLPKNRFKRILFRLHPKRIMKFWLSRDGLIMSLKVIGVGIVVCFLLLVGVFAYYRKDLPKITDISDNKLGGSITYYDRTTQVVLWQDYNAVKRVQVTGSNISSYMGEATVAIEDKNFYKHGAFDLQGIVRAGVRDLTSHGGGLQGGSTITQQLVKLNQNWTQDRTIARKFKELILAVELEREYSKQDILTGYLNTAPYGNVEYGVEAASRDYFQKSAKDLTLAESAMLAAIPQSPAYYSPYGPLYDPAALIWRQRYVLDQMVKQRMITKQQADAAKSVDILAEIHPQQAKYQGITAPYFVLAAKQELEEKYGPATVNRGGWKVITTLDTHLQTAAEQLVASNLPSVQRLTGGAADEEAIVAENVPTGQIVSLVGGTDFTNTDHGQNNYAAGILIPPGSSFKPYDYTTLIENNNNVGAGSVLYDSQGPLPGYPCTNKNTPKQDPKANCLWDYDFLYPGPLSLRYALGGSRNVPAVKAMLSAMPNDSSIGHVASINKVISTASAMMDDQYNKSTYNCYADEALTEVTQCYGASAIGDGAFLHLYDHANGLSTLARLGNAIPSTFILKITDGNNKNIYEYSQPKATQVVKQDSAYIVDDMASDPNASYLPGSCTATTCTTLAHGGYKFQRDNGWHFAVKTGTTNNGFDGLMTSWSTQYAVVSWVGNHMRNQNLSAARGAAMEQLTEPLTRGMMEAAHANLKPVNWTQPSDIKVLPAFVVRNHIHYGDIEPSPSNDLYPSWYTKSSTKGGSSQTIDKVSGKLATSCTPDLAKVQETNGNDNSFSVDIFYNNGSTAASSSPATGTDNIHNCGDALPQITLTAPDTCNISCTITATVTQGTYALSSDQYPGTVELYIDGQKIQSQTVTDSPSSVNFTYTPTSNGTSSVEAKVIDSVLYSATDSKASMTTLAGNAGGNGNGNGNGH